MRKKIANKGFKATTLETCGILLPDNKILQFDLSIKPEKYMSSRRSFLEKQPSVPIHASKYQVKLVAIHDANFPCRVEQGEASCCRVWVDDIFVAYWSADRGYTGAIMLRGIYFT